MKKVLVTGGEGFVGYHLCKKLFSGGYNITSLDMNLANNFNRRIDGVKYISDNVKNINTIFKTEKFDIIFHLGEYSRVENSFKNIRQTVDSNVHATIELLEYWRNTGAKLLYAGSSTKFSEDMLGKYSSPYAFTKASNTELVKAYGDWFDLKYAITYFYNVYGPKENEEGDYATLIGILKRRMRNIEKLPVVLPGTQKRNFTHVDDIVDALVLVGENGEGDEYGIGAKEEYSILEVCNMFGGEVEYLPERQGNRMSAGLKINRTEALGWKQKNDLKDYIDGLKNNNFVDKE